MPACAARLGNTPVEICSNDFDLGAGVQAGGVTPWVGDAEFAGSGYQAVTANLKYRF